jgi:hypothetical protein
MLGRASDPGCKKQKTAEMLSYAARIGVGVKYLDYAMPRIVYETAPPDPKTTSSTTDVYVRESAPQVVRTSSILVGFAIDGDGQPKTGGLLPLLNLWFYFGGGIAKVRLPKPDGTDEIVKPGGNAMDTGLRLGIRWVVQDEVLKLEVGTAYVGRLIILSYGEDDKKYDFGTFDLFHGPSAWLRITI